MNTTASLPEVTPTQSGQGTAAYPDPSFAHPAYGDSGYATQAPYTAPAAPAGAAGGPGATGAVGPAGTASAAGKSSPEAVRIFAIVSFVLGIASIVSGWTFLAPIAGLVFGIIALRRHTTERTLALWGVWLNGIMLAFTAIGMLIGVTILGAGLLAIPFTGF
ncbi:hypothetical protein EDF62_0630 [Leucobacter luti]|uniref:DUF4190 domain-containing protein n=1 Tax=Leucobacter luti TaxID=340320 RepID=A0A4R6S4I8_9MICO|nr:DUF4190 domain-containing protein [Leucobacter luti]TDP94223.1 hypothetical protein EDF62_0630 [Leucobacter luti]